MRTTHVPYLITWCLFVLDRFEPDFFFLLEGTDLYVDTKLKLHINAVILWFGPNNFTL